MMGVEMLPSVQPNDRVGGRRRATPDRRRWPERTAGESAAPRLTEQLAAAILGTDHFAQDNGGRLYVYRGGVYRPDGEAHIGRRVKRLTAEWQESWTSHRAREVVEYIRTDAPGLWERPPTDTISVLNGLLDVNTRELREHSPEHLTPVQLPVTYDPSADCPDWKGFAAGILPRDAQGVAFEIVAWLMTSDTSIQKAVLLLGEGSNGKSTFLAALQAFVGKANAANLTLQRVASERFASCKLMGKLANICADLPGTHLQDTSMFKALTGGDRITGEYKHGAIFEFSPFVHLIFSANRPPHSSDDSEGFFRRWLVIPFDRTFAGKTEVRREVLDARLAHPRELSGVLNEALRLLPRLRGCGFTESRSMREAHAEFRRTTDPLSVWLERATEEDPGKVVVKQRLLAVYLADCDAAGRPRPTEKAFSLALKKLRPRVRAGQRTIDGKSNAWVWLGIGLKPGGAPPPGQAEAPQGQQGQQGFPYCTDSPHSLMVPPARGRAGGEKGGCKESVQYANPVDPVDPVGCASGAAPGAALPQPFAGNPPPPAEIRL